MVVRYRRCLGGHRFVTWEVSREEVLEMRRELEELREVRESLRGLVKA